MRSAKPGENILIKFQINVEDIQKGFILSSPISPCPTATEFRVQLYLVDVVEHRPIWSVGYDCVMHLHTVEVEVTCQQINSVTDATGKVTRQRFVRQGQMCVAVLSTPLLTCMELYSSQPSLGRLTLRDEGKTIAIGKIIEILR